ncbi:MAG: TIGR02099 family protein [Xanthomonadales bacterium]|nr:TIGR02099 family protein [Xanthomonadales bacterium]
MATIAFAVLFALARLLLPWYLSDAGRVEALISGALGEVVALDRVSLRWVGQHPELLVEGLQIARGELRVEHARLQVDPYGLLPRRRLVHELAVDGIAVQLARAADGRILIAGLTGLQTGGDPRRLLGWFDRITVRGLSLRYEDPAQQLRLTQAGLAAVIDTRGIALQWGRREAGLRLVLDWDEHLTPTRAYLEARAAPLGGASGDWAFGSTGLAAARLDGEVWYRPQAGAHWWIGDLRLSGLQFTDLALSVEGPVLAGLPPELPVLHWRGQARIGAQRTLAAGQWTLGEEAPVRWNLLGDGVSSLLVAESLPLAPMTRLAEALPAVPARLRGMLAQLRPRGQLGRTELSMLRSTAGPTYRQLRVELDGVDFDSRDGKLPGLEGLRGRLSADAEAVVLDLALADARLSAPLRFRERIPIERAAGRVLLWKAAAGWTLESDRIEVVGPGYAAEGNLQLAFRADQRPFLDLLVSVPAGDVAAAPYFWLIDVMPPATVAWLDQALSTGKLSDGRWIWRGPVGKGALPYRDYEGRMEASATIRETRLAFHPDWPVGEGLAARLQFTDRGLSGTVDDARLAGNPVQGLRLELPDLKAPVLSLSLKSQAAEAAPLLSLLRQSPLRRQHAATLELLEASGPAVVDVDLVLPLKRELGSPRYSGTVELAGVDFRAAAWQLDFGALQGRARFDEGGFSASALRGRAHAAPVSAAIALGRAHTDSTALLEANLRGHFAATELAHSYPGIGRWLGAATGAADFRVDVKVQEEDGAAHTRVAIRSELQGVALDLPPPLGKPAQSTTPFAADLGFVAGAPGTVEVRWGDRLRLSGDLPGESGLRAAIALGDVPTPAAPAEGVALAAVLDGRQPAAWLGLLTGGLSGSAGGIGLAALDLLLTSSPEVGFGDTRIRARRDDAGGLQLEVEGPQVEGRLHWSMPRDQRPEALHGDFRRLWLPKLADGPGDPSRAGVAEGWSADPRRLPTLHLKVDDLRLGSAKLGSTRLETWPTREGLHVDLFEARSSALTLAGDGDWVVLPDGRQQSRFALRFTAEDLGQMLLSLGFAERIDKAQTLAEINGIWAGSPAEFALDRLQGEMRVSVGGGRFVGMDPGAGRLLGLFSIRELPRRLALDFRDFFGEGLSFDRIEGRFELSDGNAWTRDLTVNAPSAEIRVIGRTGLSQRDYDQEIVVSPQYGNVLPVVGGLAAGPAGLAAGLLAQGVIAQDQEMGRVHYAVTGSWETPKIARMPSPRSTATRPKG